MDAVNPYVYAGNGPSNKNDPSGLYLLVAGEFRRSIRLFLGSDNISFKSLGKGYYLVVLEKKDAAKKHLDKYKGDKSFKAFLWDQLISDAPITLRMTQKAFQARKQQRDPTRPEGYRYKHPRLGWIQVDKKGCAKLLYPPRSHFTESFTKIVAKNVDFSTCVAFWSVFGFADDVAIGGSALLSKRIRQWAVSKNGKAILTKLGIVGASVAVLYAIWKCHHHLGDLIKEATGPKE